MRQRLLVATCVAAMMWSAAVAPAQSTVPESEPTFITLQLTGCAGAGGDPYSINPVLSVTGTCADAETTAQRGFLVDASRQVTLFDPPGATSTAPFSINATGAITGNYADQSGIYHGFVRDPGGAFTSFDPQGSTYTIPRSINTEGSIAGYYLDANNTTHGFVRSSKGMITSFDPPNSVGTVVAGINSEGVIAGNYQTADKCYGFVRHARGTFTLFECATVQGINSRGVVAGTESGSGFVRYENGTVIRFDLPGLPGRAFIFGLNDAGTITGNYIDSQDIEHGFVRDPQGRITSFDGPNSILTQPQAIDDLGVITGFYDVSSPGGGVGPFVFLRFPGSQDEDLQPGIYSVADGQPLYVDGGFYLYGEVPNTRLWVNVPGNPSQAWKFTKVSGGFTILNQGTGQYAYDGGGELVEGSLADVWVVLPVSGGFKIKNERTGLYLTDPGVQDVAITLTTKGSTWQLSQPLPR